MIKVASIAVSSLFVAPQQGKTTNPNLPSVNKKIETTRNPEAELCARQNLPPELMAFCSSFDPIDFSINVQGGTACYEPPINNAQ
jgi:hypothetical protein